MNDNEHVLVNIPRGRPGPSSEANTELATDVGSVVGDAKDAFLRSITFRKDQPIGMNWGICLVDPPASSKSKSGWKKNKRLSVAVESVEGCVALSRIQPGDFLKSINGKRIGMSYNAARATELMNQCLEKEGVLSVAVGNEGGDDVLVQATIIKPRPNMTYEDLGIVVWFWGCLVIKSIDKDSLFKHTVLKATDHIHSINDILCDRLSPARFAHILNELPLEITIIVIRGKERWTGKFG
jgi:hypothetical protein